MAIVVAILGQSFASASGCWPGLRLTEAAWLDYLGARDLVNRTADAAQTEELFLACACLHGVTGAIERFDQRFQPLVEQVARSFDPAPHFVDDVRQELHRRLFVSGPRLGPRIGQ